jgi:hypothetical protein
MCSVLITKWDQLGIQGWGPLPELQGQGWAGFHEKRGTIFAYCSAIYQALSINLREVNDHSR